MLPIERATSSQGFSHFQRDQRLNDNVADCYGGPQLSRQNQKPHGKNKIPHGKTENLMAKTKYLTAKPKTSRQNQILHSKSKIALVLPWVFAFAVRYLVFAVKYLVLP